MLNKVKIRTKLLASFLLVAAIAAFIGIFSMQRLKKINKSYSMLYEQATKPLGNMIDLSEAFQQVRINIRDMYMAETVEQYKSKLDKSMSLSSDFDDQLVEFEKTVSTTDGRTHFDALVESKEAYMYYFPQFRELLENKKRNEARDLMNGDWLTAAGQIQKAIDDLTQYNIGYAKEISDLNSANATATMRIQVIVLIIAVFIAVLMGLLIASNIQSIIKSVIGQTKKLVDAAVNGKLDVRANSEETNEEFREIVVGVNQTLDAVIGPLNVAAGYVERISKGDIPEKITENYYGDFNIIKNNLNQCIDSLNGIVNAMNETTEKQISGDIEAFAEESSFSGSFKAMVAGYNGGMQMHINNILMILDLLKKYSEGDLKDELGVFPGKQIIATQRVNQLRQNVINLISDTNFLAESAIEGKLNTRADATRHLGDFRKIVEGINKTLDSVIEPLNVAANYIERISKGDIPPIISTVYNGDFNAIKENLNALIRANNEIIEKARLVAAGDLTVDLNKRSENDELMKSLNDMVKSTENILAEFKSASDNISASSLQMSSTSQEMSQGASEQASSAEEVSSSMEEMAANIQQNTENAQQTEKIALNAADGIKKMNEASGQTLKYMQDIADKVSIIGEIARQTNILALNAAVEAARAGEHGKGFAVVAAEVRKLAERSQVSAVEIDTLTKNSVRATEDAVKMMGLIAPEISKTAKLVQEIAAASMEQNSGADQVNNAIQQLNQVTQQNAAAAEEMATSSEELAGQAQQLLEMIAYFKLSEGTARKAVTGESIRKLHANVAHVQHLEKPVKNDNGKPAQKGFTINMGKDNLDSGYERF